MFDSTTTLKQVKQSINDTTKETTEKFIKLGKKRIDEWFDDNAEYLKNQCQKKFEKNFSRPLSETNDNVTMYSMMTSKRTLEMYYKACNVTSIVANIDDRYFTVLTDNDNWYIPNYAFIILTALQLYFDKKIESFFDSINVKAEIVFNNSNRGPKLHTNEWKLTLK